MNNAPEPESVKQLVAQITARRNGESTTPEKILRIYAEFRWGLKKAALIGPVTYRDVEALIDAALKRLEKQLPPSPLKDKAILQFTQAKTRLADWVDDEKLRADLCERCQLPRFLCDCPKPGQG